MSAVAQPVSDEEQKSGIESQKTLTKKWGGEIMALGFTAVPDILLKRMAKLNISATEMVVMIQIMSYWWSADQLPFPSKKKIAVAIGCGEKTVQRTLSRLVELNLINRKERRRAKDRNESNVYDFSPLIEQLKPMAIEETENLKREREAKEERMKPAWKKKASKLKPVQ